VDDSDERELEFVREPWLSGGQFCRVSSGTHSVLCDDELLPVDEEPVVEPASDRRVVPV
jgi:hypothetical protein